MELYPTHVNVNHKEKTIDIVMEDVGTITLREYDVLLLKNAFFRGMNIIDSSNARFDPITILATKLQWSYQ